MTDTGSARPANLRSAKASRPKQATAALTVDELLAALRLGDSAEERAQAERLLAYATEAIRRHLGDAYADAPQAIKNEATIRLAGYAYDKPTATSGASYANELRNSGAAAILLPYREHRAGAC